MLLGQLGGSDWKWVLHGPSSFLCVPLCTTTEFLKAWWLGSQQHSEGKVHSMQDSVKPLHVSCLLESKQEKNWWECRPGEEFNWALTHTFNGGLRHIISKYGGILTFEKTAKVERSLSAPSDTLPLSKPLKPNCPSLQHSVSPEERSQGRDTKNLNIQVLQNQSPSDATIDHTLLSFNSFSAQMSF